MSPRRFVTALLAGGLLLAPTAQVAAEEEAPTQVNLTAGHSSLLRFANPVDKASVNDQAIADVVVISPTQLLVQGKHPGSTSILVWRGEESQLFTVAVEVDTIVLDQALKRVLPVETIDTHSASGVVIISGEVSSQRVSDEASLVAKSYAEHVVNLLHVKAGQFEQLLHALVPEDQITVHQTGDTIILGGKAKHPANVAKAVQAASGAAEHVVNIVDLPDIKQVLIQVRFAEVQRSVAKALGIDYLAQGRNVTQSGFIGGTLAPQTPSTPRFARINPTDIALSSLTSHLFEYRGGGMDFSVALNALEQQGLVRILAEPNLLAMSGEEACFLAGGEFPVPVAQSGTGAATTITIQFKEFGIRLNFKPDVTADDAIRLHVEPEVSVLDFTESAIHLSGFTIPGLVTRRAKTTVQMRSNESLVIGGLLSQTDTKTSSKVPGLGNIPVLGKLFSSEKFKNEETELLVLVTPKLVEPVEADARQIYNDPKAVHAALQTQVAPSPYAEERADAIRKTLGAAVIDRQTADKAAKVAAQAAKTSAKLSSGAPATTAASKPKLVATPPVVRHP